MNFDEKVLLGGIECYLRLIERLNQSQVLRESAVMIKEIKDNHLFWDGCDTVALAKEFGTPLYVFR